MNEDLLALYDILEKEGVFSSQEEMQSVIDAEGIGVLYDAVPSGVFGSKEEFLSAFQSEPQEELTPEMMETGQRDAAPAYAMTEEKYAAEKKSAGESPLQDGASAFTELSDEDEAAFQDWWKNNESVNKWREEFKRSYGYEPTLDGYDYRGAWEAGIEPSPTYEPETGETRYHWDSIGVDGKKLKPKGHPTEWKSNYMEATGINPDEAGITKEQALRELSKMEPVVDESIEQPSEKYLIDGSSVSKGEVYRKLNNQNFLKSLEAGDASIEIKDDPEMQKYLADQTKGLQKGFVEEGDEIITPDLMSKEEEDVVPYLNYQFGDKGFVFEESGVGDNVIAKALDSEGNVVAEEEFALDLSSRKAGSTIGRIFKETFLTGADEEANRLKTWLNKNQDPVRKVEAQKQEQLLKFKDKSQIDKSFKELASIEDNVNESMNGFISKRTEFETELDKFESEREALDRRIENGTATQDEVDAFNSKAQDLNAKSKELSSIQGEIKKSVESASKRRAILNRSVGRFAEYQGVLEEQGNFFGAVQSKLASGIGRIGSGNISAWIDVLVEAIPESAVRGVNDDRPIDEVQDELKKQLKAEILPAVRKGSVEYYGSDVSPEYLEKVERLGADPIDNPLYFGYAAVLGAMESIPAMVGPSPSGKATAAKTIGGKILNYLTDAGNIVRATSMAAQVSDHVEEEMANSPLFKDVSENEKRLVSAPIAIVGGVLENIGFRNIVNKSGVIQDVTMAVLKKSGKKVTAETFEELVQKEVKSRIARGTLVLASGALAEAETGLFQEISDINIKRIYNKLKGKEMFDTPEAFSAAYYKQVATAALQEAIGGMALGSVGALSSAMNNDYYFDSVSDIEFDLFTKMSENPEFKTSIVTDIKNKINSGEMTAEQGKTELENIEKIQAALNRIPSDYSAANKKKALSLIMRQDAIKREVAGKDENLTKRQRAEIEKINQMLEDTDQQAFLEKERQDAIQEQGPEGMDVQEPTRDSEAVGEGDVRETTEEGRPKITVTEETQEVTDETLKDLENVPEPVIRGLAVKTLNGEALTEQEQQVFEAQQEAVEQMASDIEQNIQAEAEVGGQLRGETSAEDRSVIARQVNRAKRAISKILPDVEIVMHDTEDSYNGVITDPEGKGTAGTYDPETNKIHINMSKANVRTVAHEVFHAVVRRALGGGKLYNQELAAATVKMLDAVRRGAGSKVLNKVIGKDGVMTVSDYIEMFADGYKKSEQKEEQLSELAGFLASEFMELDVNAKTTIKAWIGRMAEKLGINKALGTNIYSREMSDKDAIDLLNTIAGKTAKGEIIKEAKTLEEIFGEKEVAEIVSKTGIINLPSISKVHLDVLKDAAKKAGVSVEQFVASAIDKTKATYKNASDAVKRAVDAVIEAMRIDLSVADIIDNIPKPDLKRVVDSAVSRLPKVEADVLKGAAKKAKMTVEDFVFAVVSKTYDASKRVVAIANKVAETVAANGRRIALIAAMVSIPSGSNVGVNIDRHISSAYQYAKDAAQSAIIEMLESNETVSQSAKIVYDSGVINEIDPIAARHLERALMITGVVEPSNEVQEVQVREEEEIDYDNEKYLVEQTYTEDLGSPNAEPDAAKFRVQFPLESGKEVILIPTHEGREASGKKQTEGVKFIMHQTLDYDPVNNVTHDYNSGFHRTSKSFDGFVPVLIKKKGERGVITYKRYSEINDSTDVMMGPLRQFKFTELDWDGKGTPIMASAREINLKGGKKSPYRRAGLTYNGRPISEGGTDLIWTPAAAGKDGYGKFQGGGVVFIFEDLNGNRFAREFAGSINAMKSEGESIAKTFGIPAESITIGTHDVGSFSKKLRAENGVIKYDDIDAMNSENPTGGAVAIAVEETGMVSPRFQKPIKATVDFRSRTGKTFSVSKEFNNKQHLDNYIKFREKKGDKEIGTTIGEAKEVETPKPQKRRFANKAVINVGNQFTGESTLEVGRLNPIMIDNQEFARMTAIDIPKDNKFASTERDLYTRSVETAVSEGLGGVVIPKSVFNEIAVDENRFDVNKRGDEFVVTPKIGNVLTSRFQANYTNPVTGVTYIYDKNLDAWKKLVDIGKITKDKTIKYIQDKMIMVHAPDAAFSGELQRNGETLIEGKGGLYFPIKFMGQNLVWASTRRAAEKMAQQFNEMAKANGGRAYMVLTSAPYDKVLSSTIAANGVMDIFINKAVDRKVNVKKADILSAIINSANTKEEVRTEDENGKVSIKMVGLGIGLSKTSKFEDAISAIREKLGSDNSSFSDRKMFSETLAGEMAKLINSSDAKTANFFFELFNNPQFKGKIAKGTGRYSASKANIIQGLSYMLAEPSLRPLLDPNIGGKKGMTGMAYAILEAEGPFEAVEIEGHESYPVGIKGMGAINIHLLETPVKWTKFVVDPKTGKTIASDKRAKSIMPPSAGISMTPLMVDASEIDVADNEISLKFQNPTATAYTIHDAINELRGKGYTESAIALFISRQINPDTQKNYTKGEVTALLEIPIDIENTLPSAFGDVEGGVAQGQRMFTEVMEKVRRSAARMRPANSSKIRAKAHQILMAHPDFDKQSATVKNRLILGLDSALGTTANKAIQAEISAIKKMIKGGKMSLKELKAAQVRLRAMIRKELPNDKAYSKTVVNNLIKMVTDATPETMDQVVNDVTSTINEQRSEKFISEIEGILNQKFETTQAGRKKGAKVTATFADAISFAKSKLAEIRKASENEDDFQTIMDKTRAERDALFSEIDTMTEEDISMVLAYDLVLQYGKTFVESNIEQDTVDGLELSLDMAKDLINTGRAFMKDQLRMAHEAYKEQFNTAFEDITGIDVRGMDENQRADVSGSFRVGAEQRGKNLSNAAKAMMRVVDRANKFFAKNEDLAGFMDILSRGAGEMFGGKLQELVKQRVDDSSTVFKRGMMDMRSTVEAKQREIFGKNWKKVMANNRVPIKTGLTAFGKDLTYSQNEMYYLYNMAKDPANHPSFEEKFGKEWREVMDGIEALMTPEIKEWADWQVNEFYPMMWERYNPVYRRIYRTNLGWNKFYAGKIYRQSVDGSEDIDLLEQKMGPSMSVAGGSTKHRVKNNRPIAAVDGNLAMGRYLEEMEKFRAYQETVRDVSKLFNNEDIKNAIIEKYGKDFHNLFSTMLERYLTGKTEKGKLGSIVGTGNRVFIFAKLGYNLSLVWKQLTSIPTYANDIGFVNWGVYAAKAATARKVLSKEMYENSTYLQDRYAGDFMGVVDVFSKNKENAMSVGAGADFYINEASDAVTRYGMLYTKAGDALAIFLGGSPNYLYYKDQFKKKNPNATEQEAINYAIKKFEKDTRGTQQSSDIQDRDFYQTGNEFVRSMMLFTTSPRQYWRKSMSGYRQLYRKMKGVPSKGSITDNLRTIVMYRFMMPMLYTWATMGFPPPWDLDDEEQDDLMWSAILGNISALFMIGHIGIALKDFMTDKPWAGRMPLPPIMQIASDMIDTMRSISKTKDPLERSIKEEEMYMKMVSNVVPSKNLDKSFGNWYRTASGDQDFNALKMAGYSDYIADRDERQMKEEMDAILKMFEQVNKDKGSGSRELKEIKELKEIR